jgi:hypothetical protein
LVDVRLGHHRFLSIIIYQTEQLPQLYWHYCLW